MPTGPIEQRTFAYVVRIWWERRDVAGAAPQWRGSVDDVQSGERRYFDSSRALCRFLDQRAQSGVPPTRLRDRLRRWLPGRWNQG